jgi:hypothetical protein
MRSFHALASLLFVLVLASIGSPQVGQSAAQYGGVKGSVVDEGGSPVEGAWVLNQTGLASLGGDLAISDEQGRFYLPRIPAGREFIYAQKENSGFIDWHFFSSGPFHGVVIQLAPSQIISGVILHLQKGGSLGGPVIDCQTGRPVRAPTITVAEIDQPKALPTYVSTGANGSLHIVLPPRPFKLKAVADGYVDWQYPAPSSPEPGFIIPVGQRKTLVIAMQPVGGRCQ